MSIFLSKDSKVIVQGITGGEGTKHTALMLKAGTEVVGGVNARKAGTHGAAPRRRRQSGRAAGLRVGRRGDAETGATSPSRSRRRLHEGPWSRPSTPGSDFLS